MALNYHTPALDGLAYLFPTPTSAHIVLQLFSEPQVVGIIRTLNRAIQTTNATGTATIQKRRRIVQKSQVESQREPSSAEVKAIRISSSPAVKV